MNSDSRPATKVQETSNQKEDLIVMTLGKTNLCPCSPSALPFLGSSKLFEASLMITSLSLMIPLLSP